MTGARQLERVRCQSLARTELFRCGPKSYSGIRDCDSSWCSIASRRWSLQRVPAAPPGVLSVDFACDVLSKIRICIVPTEMLLTDSVGRRGGKTVSR